MIKISKDRYIELLIAERILLILEEHEIDEGEDYVKAMNEYLFDYAKKFPDFVEYYQNDKNENFFDILEDLNIEDIICYENRDLKETE